MKNILINAVLIMGLGAAYQALADYCPNASSIHYVTEAEVWEAPGNWVGSKSMDDGIKTIIAFKEAVYPRFNLPVRLLTCQYQTAPKGEILVMGNDKSRTYSPPTGQNWLPDGAGGLFCNGPDIINCPF